MKCPLLICYYFNSWLCIFDGGLGLFLYGFDLDTCFCNTSVKTNITITHDIIHFSVWAKAA